MRFLIISIAVIVTLALGIALSGHAYAQGTETSSSAGIPWWAIVSLFGLALSEALALIPKFKSNSMVQLIINVLKSVFGPADKK